MYKKYKVYLLVLGISIGVFFTGCSGSEKLKEVSIAESMQETIQDSSQEVDGSKSIEIDEATDVALEEPMQEVSDDKNVEAEVLMINGIESSVPEKEEKRSIVTEESVQKKEENQSTKVGAAIDEETVDIDLTKLSSTMVYAEVYNMMVKPEDYMGKTIKMKGLYTADYFQTTDMYYHYILIEDALACCQSGIEFVWDNNSHQYPEEYPAIDAPIQIVGTFGSYEELGQTYYYLAVDEIEK